MKNILTFTAVLMLAAGSFFSCKTAADPQVQPEPDFGPAAKTTETAEGVTMPKGSEEMITRVLAERGEPMEEYIYGETGYVYHDGFDLWYNSISPGEARETVLLLSGIGESGFNYPRWLLKGLEEAGYHIIRFDYRDTGSSDWDEDWSYNTSYTLTDLAEDAVAILDANGVDRFHIMGISMGGMVAQELSIQYPQRVKSVISTISTGFLINPEIPYVDKMTPFLEKCLAQFNNFENPANSLRITLAFLEHFKGTDPRDMHPDDMYEALKATLYAEERIPDSNPDAGRNHGTAVYRSGSRLDDLTRVQIPYLAIHGKADTTIVFEHALLYSSKIPNCETLWIDEMGHGLPRHDSELIITTILDFLERSC